MLSFCVWLRCSENGFRNPNWAKHVSGISRDPQWWDSFIVSFPYYSHTTPIRIPKDMGIVWETYDKWVPLLGVPGNTPWTWTCSLLKLCVCALTQVEWRNITVNESTLDVPCRLALMVRKWSNCQICRKSHTLQRDVDVVFLNFGRGKGNHGCI